MGRRPFGHLRRFCELHVQQTAPTSRRLRNRLVLATTIRRSCRCRGGPSNWHQGRARAASRRTAAVHGLHPRRLESQPVGSI